MQKQLRAGEAIDSYIGRREGSRICLMGRGEQAMVSGWDKKPGPGNDYTPAPSSLAGVAVYICVFLVLIFLTFMK
jgi:hypothetical protein